MSKRAKEARKAMHAKIARITKSEGDNSKHQIDASDFVGYPDLNSTAKTGARPISRRQFRKGGKVVKMHGEHAKHHAGRKARKSGGKALTANSLINRNVREANEEREGVKHVGAFKRGGRSHKASGGADNLPIQNVIGGASKQNAMKAMRAMKAISNLRNAASAARATHRTAPGIGAPAGMSPIIAKKGGKIYRAHHKTDGGVKGDFSKINKIMRDQDYRRDNPPPPPPMPRDEPMVRGKPPLGEYEGGQDTVTMDGKKRGGRARKADGGSFVPTGRMSFNQGTSQARRLAGFKSGGNTDEVQDKKLIKKAFRQHENAEHGGKHSELHLKKGGYAKKAGGGSSGSSIAGGGSSITGGYSGMTDAEVSGRKAGMEDYPRIKRVQDAAVQPLRAIRQATDYIGEKYGDLRDSTRSVLSGDPDDEEFRKGQRDVRNNILGYKKGGKVSSASKRGGSMSVSDGSLEGTRPVGGRLARKHGGNAGKGKMNVNIIIAQKPEGAALGSPMAHPPMPMPPPGMPHGGMPPGAGGGMPPGMPPMPPPGAPGPMGMPPGIIGRKSGGKVGHRSYKSVKDMDAGAGGGEGRMEKLKIYGLKPSQTTKNY